jgi:hypothetical protein
MPTIIPTTTPKRRELIHLENTRFIYSTNFSGDPKRDRFGSSEKKGNIIIPDHNQAIALMNEGFNVKRTEPKPGEEEGFVPTYYVSVKANYDSNWPPKIYFVSGNSEPRLLDEESLVTIDTCRVRNVNVVLSPYSNPNTHRSSLYVRTMYVEQDIESDPFASRYNWGYENSDCPF